MKNISKVFFIGLMISLAYASSLHADIIDEESDESSKLQPQPTQTIEQNKPKQTPDAPAGTPTVKTPDKKPSSGSQPQTIGSPTKASQTSKVGQEKAGSEKEPVNFTGGGLSISLQKGQKTVELVKTPEKDLVITQGDLRMESDKAIVFFDNKSDEVSKVEATGNVKLFKKDPETGKPVRAFAGKVVFHNNTRKIILSQNPRLWRGEEQQLTGKRITYELDTGWIRVDEAEGVMKPGSSN